MNLHELGNTVCRVAEEYNLKINVNNTDVMQVSRKIRMPMNNLYKVSF